MKIRTDFVTNSSSSSFIVVLDKELVDVETVKEVFFHNQETLLLEIWDQDYVLKECSTLEISTELLDRFNLIDVEDAIEYYGDQEGYRDSKWDEEKQEYVPYWLKEEPAVYRYGKPYIRDGRYSAVQELLKEFPELFKESIYIYQGSIGTECEMKYYNLEFDRNWLEGIPYIRFSHH